MIKFKNLVLKQDVNIACNLPDPLFTLSQHHHNIKLFLINFMAPGGMERAKLFVK